MLTDQAYLKHMIPHHQVAVVMSENLQRSSHSPTMLEFARQIIFIQEIEIAWMKGMVESGVPDISSSATQGEHYTPGNLVNCYYPNKSQDLSVKPGYMPEHMFNPEMHVGKKIGDVEFLKHMIPHHQIAINMSRKLLKYTKDIRMVELAYKIINSQQAEILKMKQILSGQKLILSSMV